MLSSFEVATFGVLAFPSEFYKRTEAIVRGIFLGGLACRYRLGRDSLVSNPDLVIIERGFVTILGVNVLGLKFALLEGDKADGADTSAAGS